MNNPFLRYRYGGVVSPQQSSGLGSLFPVQRLRGGGTASGPGDPDPGGGSFGGIGKGAASMGQVADARAAAEAAARASYAPNTMDFNARQAADDAQAKDQGFLKTAWDSLFTKDPVDRTGLQAERDAASPGPDFDFLQNQAASGIAGLLPGVSSSPAGTEGGGSYYDAVRLAMITGITVPQAQAYLDSMYGTA